MFNLNNLIRANILNMVEYSNARSESMGMGNVFLDANENPYGVFNRYPDPSQNELKTEVAKWINLETNQIAIGNGSDELIDLLLRIFCRPGFDKSLCFTPSYGMYDICSQVNDVEMISFPLSDSFQIDINLIKGILFNPLIKIVFICSPNNPTGNLISTSTIKYILEIYKGLVVVDEAYIDFSKSDSLVSLLGVYPNLVILQTMSKAWGLAGARIGFAFADESIIGIINKIKAPYNISTLNQKAAIDVLKNHGAILNNIERIKVERVRLELNLNELSIVRKVYSSDSNFLLVEFNDALKVYQYLFDNNIVVRNRCKLISNCLRITIGSFEENTMMLDTLKAIDL